MEKIGNGDQPDRLDDLVGGFSLFAIFHSSLRHPGRKPALAGWKAGTQRPWGELLQPRGRIGEFPAAALWVPDLRIARGDPPSGMTQRMGRLSFLPSREKTLPKAGWGPLRSAQPTRRAIFTLCVIPAVSLPLQAGEPGPRGPWGELLQPRGRIGEFRAAALWVPNLRIARGNPPSGMAQRMGRLPFWMKRVTGASCRNEPLIRLHHRKIFSRRRWRRVALSWRSPGAVAAPLKAKHFLQASGDRLAWVWRQLAQPTAVRTLLHLSPGTATVRLATECYICYISYHDPNDHPTRTA
jgi:hypothetical protein